MKKIAITISLWAIFLATNAQNKMERDLKIFTTMLEDFINKKESNMFSHKNITTKYYEGFGVIVQMPPLGTGWKHWEYFLNNELSVGNDKMFFSPDWDGGKFQVRGKIKIIDDIEETHQPENKTSRKEKTRKEEDYAKKEQEKARKDHEKALENHKKIMKEHEKVMREHEKQMRELHKHRQSRQEIILKKQDSLLAVERKENDEKVRSFLVEYADLLTELKPNEKIRVLYSQSSYSKIVGISWDNEERGFSTTKFSDNPDSPKGLEVLKSDIDDFKTKKINEKTFREKIKNIPKQKNADQTHFEVLAGVLDKLVDNVQEKQILKKVGTTRMFYLEGYGVEYDTKLIQLSNILHSIDANTIYKVERDSEGHTKIYIDMSKANSNEDAQKKMNEQIENTKNKTIEFENAIELKAKEYLLLYGKAQLPFLKNNEKITWVLDMNTPKIFGSIYNKDEKVAELSTKKITFTLTRQTLEKFDNKQISLEQAMKEVRFEKL